MTGTDDVAPDECLGRRVFSNRDRNRAKREKTPLKVFLEKEGTRTISTDRVDVVNPDVIAAIADKSAANRSGPFRGWAVVSRQNACKRGRHVCASPLPDNPYHADIVLPEAAALDPDEQEVHAQELARCSKWRERPGGQTDGSA